MSCREERWERLYNELLDALAPLGKNDAVGDGDFWLVDDDWGGHHHKICVAKPEFWSCVVEDEIRKVLAGSFQDWGVFVVFECGVDRPGLIVYADSNVIEPDEPRWP
jgi:hypothetical protein